MIVDLNTRADGAPDAPELQAAIAAAGGTLATCEERYWCDEINVFLVQLPERRWACWDFALALEERVPYPLADVHYPPVPATCSCDMGWWATGELRDTGRIDR